MGAADDAPVTTHRHAVLQQTLAGVVGIVASNLSRRLERVLVDLFCRRLGRLTFDSASRCSTRFAAGSAPCSSMSR
jgi:hypothetical protein